VTWSIGHAADGYTILSAEHESRKRAPVRSQLVTDAAQQRLASDAQLAERLPTSYDHAAQLPVARAKQPCCDYEERQAGQDRQEAAGHAQEHTQQRKRTADCVRWCGQVRWDVWSPNFHSGSTHSYKLAMRCVYGTRSPGAREAWEDERYLMGA